ncbi:hypothetical protein SDJN02_20747, partial [Cucurbita argyrosperma subsp. argyrosperma]
MRRRQCRLTRLISALYLTNVIDNAPCSISTHKFATGLVGWLLHSSNASKLKKLKSHGFEMETTTPYVWAEAMPIDSVDICTLPYKLKAHGFEMETTTLYVWAEATLIDSVAICALPYVVPY